MEAGGGSARRRRLSDGSRDAMAGLTLGAVLGSGKIPAAPVQINRTLLDIIRDEEPNTGPYKDLINHHNKKSWKSFKDRLRLRRAGAAWTSSVHIPTSDVSIQNFRSQLSRRQSTRFQTMSPNSGESAQDMTLTENQSVTENVPVCDDQICRPQFSRRSSIRVSSFTAESTQSITQSDGSPVTDNASASDVPIQNSRSQILRRNTSRLPSYTAHSTEPMTRSEGSFIIRENIVPEHDSVPSIRLSAALAAEREEQQRAALSTEEPSSPEAENGVAAAAAVPQTEAEAPVRMSLMDLLEETDRQMGWSSYMAEAEEEEEEVDDNGGDEEGRGGGEHNCCVCMVRHKGAAFIPCGHTFCRQCSRELWVSRGNCPLCNGFILEILDIF